MTHNFLVYFLFISIILVSIFLQWSKYSKGETELLKADFKLPNHELNSPLTSSYLKNCFHGNIYCNDDSFCKRNCLNSSLDWTCKSNTCIPRAIGNQIVNCAIGGHIQTFYDDAKKSFVSGCVCNDEYHNNHNKCSDFRFGCMKINAAGQCICQEDHNKYTWTVNAAGDYIDVCIDKKYEKLFNHQPHFRIVF